MGFNQMNRKYTFKVNYLILVTNLDLDYTIVPF